MGQFVKVGSLEELPEGSAREVECEGRMLALFRVGGEVRVIDGICPHQGGPLADGDLKGTMVTCPWHGWEIDVVTGKCGHLARVQQTVYEVKLEGDDILVGIP